MLRLRSITGEIMEIPEAFRFVEIINREGEIGRLLYSDADGAVHDVRTGEPEALRYTQLFHTKFCPVIRLPS